MWPHLTEEKKTRSMIHCPLKLQNILKILHLTFQTRVWLNTHEQKYEHPLSLYETSAEKQMKYMIIISMDAFTKIVKFMAPMFGINAMGSGQYGHFWQIYTNVFCFRNHDKFWKHKRLQVYLYLYQSWVFYNTSSNIGKLPVFKISSLLLYVQLIIT